MGIVVQTGGSGARAPAPGRRIDAGTGPVRVARDRSGPGTLVADLFALTRPRVTGLVLFTTLAGILLAPGSIGAAGAIATVLSTAAIAGACSCFNMVIERRGDGLMKRTRNRPIPAGRLRPSTAVLFGTSLMAAGFPLLHAAAGGPATILGAAASILYVWAYTPLKTRSPAALFVGAISGAMPILMGHAAVTGGIDGRGAVLFALLYAWQFPHFLSIALIHAEDYRRAGILVHPVAIGPERTRRHRVIFGLLLWLVSMIPATFDGVGPLYTAAALLSGAAFLTAGMRSLRAAPRTDLDRSYFLWTLGHVPLLLIALIADAPVPGATA